MCQSGGTRLRTRCQKGAAARKWILPPNMMETADFHFGERFANEFTDISNFRLERKALPPLPLALCQEFRSQCLPLRCPSEIATLSCWPGIALPTAVQSSAQRKSFGALITYSSRTRLLCDGSARSTCRCAGGRLRRPKHEAVLRLSHVIARYKGVEIFRADYRGIWRRCQHPVQ